MSTARSALVKLATLARAAGAKRVLALSTPATWQEVSADDGPGWDAYLARLANFDFAPNRATVFSAHQMGTARAGADPRTSATDPFGRVRRDDRGSRRRRPLRWRRVALSYSRGRQPDDYRHGARRARRARRQSGSAVDRPALRFRQFRKTNDIEVAFSAVRRMNLNETPDAFALHLMAAWTAVDASMPFCR